MEAIDIYSPYVYSIQYDGQDQNEFDRLFTEWSDVESVTNFLERNKDYLKTTVWERTPEPESAARQVLDEAGELENLFDKLAENTQKGEHPDFDSHFHYLDGKYKYELEYQPMKSYSGGRPPLLRIYAIKKEHLFNNRRWYKTLRHDSKFTGIAGSCVARYRSSSKLAKGQWYIR